MGDKKKKTKKEDLVDLVDVIDNLRTELLAAKKNAEKEENDLKFYLKEIEVELHTVIQDSTKGEGGFDFKIVKFGGSKTDTDSRTQLIRFKLEPELVSKTDEEGQGNKAKSSKFSINAPLDD